MPSTSSYRAASPSPAARKASSLTRQPSTTWASTASPMTPTCQTSAPTCRQLPSRVSPQCMPCPVLPEPTMACPGIPRCPILHPIRVLASPIPLGTARMSDPLPPIPATVPFGVPRPLHTANPCPPIWQALPRGSAWVYPRPYPRGDPVRGRHRQVQDPPGQVCGMQHAVPQGRCPHRHLHLTSRLPSHCRAHGPKPPPPPPAAISM